MILAWGWFRFGGSATVETPTVAGGYDERKKKRYFVQRGDKLLVFSTAQAAFDAAQIPKKVIAEPVIAEVIAEAPRETPELTIHLPEVKQYAKAQGKIKQYNAAFGSGHFEALLAIFLQMHKNDSEEDDIECLLMVC